MKKEKPDIVTRICIFKFKNPKVKILKLSLDDFMEYIKWDNKNLGLYKVNFEHPDDILGFKVKLLKKN